MDKILVMATIALTTNEIKRNLLNEAVLIYLMYWAILSLLYYFENNNFRNRVIHWIDDDDELSSSMVNDM